MQDPTDLDDGRSMFERMLAGDPYRADDPEILAGLDRAARLTHQHNVQPPDDPDARRAILADLLGSIGADVVVRAPFYCDFGSNTTIGRGTFVNSGLVALDCGRISIGEDVQIATNVQLLTPSHPIDPVLRRAGWESADPIVIEDDVWLGGGVIVLPGVTVGARSVVGAGSVVTKDVPPDVVVVGNPARVVRSI